MKDWKIRQGDSTPIKKVTIKGVNNYTENAQNVGEDEEVPAGDVTYTGKLVILDATSNRLIKTMPFLTVDPLEGFGVVLPPEVTQELGVGTYRVVFEINASKAATPDDLTYRKEMDWKVTIEKSLLNE